MQQVFAITAADNERVVNPVSDVSAVVLCFVFCVLCFVFCVLCVVFCVLWELPCIDIQQLKLHLNDCPRAQLLHVLLQSRTGCDKRDDDACRDGCNVGTPRT